MTKTPANDDGDRPPSTRAGPSLISPEQGRTVRGARLMYDVINSPRARGIIMPGGGEVSSVELTAPPVTASPAAKGCRRVGGELDVSRKDERTQSNLTVRMFHVTPPSLGIPEGGHLSLFRAYVCKENYERIYRVCARYATSTDPPPTSATRNSDCRPGHLY